MSVFRGAGVALATPMKDNGEINYEEVKLYDSFCKSCEIENSFRIEDYPECTLSGPFVNPEDLYAGI